MTARSTAPMPEMEAVSIPSVPAAVRRSRGTSSPGSKRTSHPLDDSATLMRLLLRSLSSASILVPHFPIRSRSARRGNQGQDRAAGARPLHLLGAEPVAAGARAARADPVSSSPPLAPPLPGPYIPWDED